MTAVIVGRVGWLAVASQQRPCGVRSVVGLLVGGRLFRRSERSWMEVAEDSERLGRGVRRGRSVCKSVCDYRNYDKPLEVLKVESHTSHLTGMDVKIARA
jgi:hypothetical protein